MFVKKKRNRSGTTSVVVAEKIKESYRELTTIGVSKEDSEVMELVRAGQEWIEKERLRRHPRLDLFGEELEACDRERDEVRRVLSQVSNILLNGCDLILDRIFDRVGFNRHRGRGVPQTREGAAGVSGEQGSHGGVPEEPLRRRC